MLQEQETRLKWNNIQSTALVFPFQFVWWLKYIYQLCSSSEYQTSSAHIVFKYVIAFTSISQGCMWRCYGRKNGASWWWPQLSSWSQMFSICQNFLLDKKWWIQDQLDSEDNTCGPVLLYPCTDALFFKSVSSNVSSDLLLQIHQQGGGGSSPKLPFEISPLFSWSFFFEPVISNVSWNASSSNVKGS